MATNKIATINHVRVSYRHLRKPDAVKELAHAYQATAVVDRETADVYKAFAKKMRAVQHDVRRDTKSGIVRRYNKLADLGLISTNDTPKNIARELRMRSHRRF